MTWNLIVQHLQEFLKVEFIFLYLFTLKENYANFPWKLSPGVERVPALSDWTSLRLIHSQGPGRIALIRMSWNEWSNG